jgi:hypothetical protein
VVYKSYSCCQESFKHFEKGFGPNEITPDGSTLRGRIVMLSAESRRLAGILLVVFPTVIYGGVSLLLFLIGRSPGYLDNQNLFRAGHAHAGVLLVLSLVALRYVDEAELSSPWKALSGVVSQSRRSFFQPVSFFPSHRQTQRHRVH